MKQVIGVDVFDSDERLIVNKACESIPIADFTREGFLANLIFSRNISTEQDILDMLDGLIAKTERISDEEWEYLKTKMPFTTFYDADDDADIDEKAV